MLRNGVQTLLWQAKMAAHSIASRAMTWHGMAWGTYLAAVARLSRPLRVGELALDRRGEVIVSRRLCRAGRARVLDALDLVNELRFVLRGPLRGHVAARADGIFRMQTRPLGSGGGLINGARLTLCECGCSVGPLPPTTPTQLAQERSRPRTRQQQQDVVQ
jgi:hypothetical protein